MSGLARWSAARTVHRAPRPAVRGPHHRPAQRPGGTTYPDLGDRDTHSTGFDRLGQGRPLGLPVAVWITVVPAVLVTVLLC
ncbi:hypothetical protein [Streptomyces sp. NPDC055681]